jgi:methylmalonyl-CoA/ethylmalonyl-CoA epimerase
VSSWSGRRVDHVGIAVRDLDVALAFYRPLAGPPAHRELVAHDGVEVAFLKLGGTELELLASRAPDSSVQRFLDRRGEGLHHLALEVGDLAAELAEWRARGAQLIDEAPRPGARGRQVAFIHPRSALGVLVELCQRVS